jgi:O-antigen/teichoic acid export membrane protein
MSSLKIVKNAFANLCRGGAAALVVLFLPPFLTRILDKDTYGTWLLILQLSTYVSFLDFGMQTAVGKFVAHCNELGDTKQRDSLISTSIAILSGAAVLAMLGISILAWQLPHLFKDMPTSLRQDAYWSLLFVGGSLAISLPFSVFGAIFIGLQRYDIPAWIIGISKLLGGIFVVLVAQSSHSIVMMGVVMGLANLCTGLWQFIAYKKIIGSYHISLMTVTKKSALEVIDCCFSLSISSFGVLLVSGLDISIIGFFDYKSIPYYVIASALTNFVFGTSSAILTTILPIASVIGAKNESERLGDLLISTTKYAIILSAAINLPVMLLSETIISLWINHDYAIHTNYLLQLLITANFIRIIGAPYFMIAIGCGEHRQVVLSPLIEAFVNLLVSLIFTSKFGASGVAIGTLIGGFVSVGMHFGYNLPRTVKIRVPNRTDFFLSLIKLVGSIVIPLMVAIFIVTNMFVSVSVRCLLILILYVILWRFCLSHQERYTIFSNIKIICLKNA